MFCLQVNHKQIIWLRFNHPCCPAESRCWSILPIHLIKPRYSLGFSLSLCLAWLLLIGYLGSVTSTGVFYMILSVSTTFPDCPLWASLQRLPGRAHQPLTPGFCPFPLCLHKCIAAADSDHLPQASARMQERRL